VPHAFDGAVVCSGLLIQTAAKLFWEKAIKQTEKACSTPGCHTRESGYPLAFSELFLKMDSCFRRNDKKDLL
jgi:hypothetical protein